MSGGLEALRRVALAEAERGDQSRDPRRTCWQGKDSRLMTNAGKQPLGTERDLAAERRSELTRRWGSKGIAAFGAFYAYV